VELCEQIQQLLVLLEQPVTNSSSNKSNHQLISNSGHSQLSLSFLYAK
jgi:hypothetical protein